MAGNRLESAEGGGRPGAQGHSTALRHGAMGVVAIVLFVVATSGPLGVAVGNLPLLIGLGNGVGAPGTFVLAGAVLTLFAIGYTAMSQRITNAGAFYAYVSAGLGRAAGVSAGWVANLAYTCILLYMCGYMGFFANYVFDAELGVNIPWQVFAFGSLAAVTLLGIRGVEVNAKILGLFLMLETGLLALIDVAVLVEQGIGSFSLSAFDPSTVFSGAPGVAFVFAFLSFVGFEATAIFGEEAKDPRRTIRRATYAAVIFITVFYTLTTWAMVSAHPADKVGEIALSDPGGFIPGVASANLGGWSSHAVNWLLMTSLLAITIAIHNMAARYFYAFGRAGLLPRAFGRTHSRYKTPYVAGIVQASITAVVVAVFALAGADPYLDLAATTAGVGTLAVLVLMAATCIAVIAYFRRDSSVGRGVAVAAPALAFLGLGGACVLIVDNFSTVTGSESGVVTNLPWLIPIVAVLGFIAGRLRPGREAIDVFALEAEDERLAVDAELEGVPA
jgi:amino acid transporter